MDDSIKPNFSASHKGHFQKAQNFVVFFRSQTHSYAYHLVSVRRHNQHVRSPIQGFFRCEGISFIPRVQQRSTFPRLPPQERQNYITSPRPVSTAPLAPVRGSGVGNKEHPTPLCLSVLPPHPKRVVPTHPQRVIPTTPLWVYRHTPCRYYRHTLRWYYRQPPRGYYRKRQRGREIARRRSWERYIDV